MALLFRSMQEDGNGLPAPGCSARHLGVRPGFDVPAVLPTDLVQPGQGGMSVSPDDPMNLPYFRRPPTLQGTGKDPVWEIEVTRLGPDLVYRADPNLAGHGFVEAARTMTLAEYEQALTATQPFWTKNP
jgi:hypothetical protein